MPVRALRGATTVDHDSATEVYERVGEMLRVLMERNELDHDDVISMVLTATDDIHSTFPATAARAAGFGEVPLLCARELDVAGAPKHCIRVMMHLETDRDRSELRHVYLRGAIGLRGDLPR